MIEIIECTPAKPWDWWKEPGVVIRHHGWYVLAINEDVAIHHCPNCRYTWIAKVSGDQDEA